MKEYFVDITEPALADMDDIYQYTIKRFGDPARAGKLYDTIAKEILSLERMPLRYGIPQFEPCIQLELRRMLVDKYSVFYLVDGDTVTVTDVIYSSSDLEAQLGQRHDESTG